MHCVLAACGALVHIVSSLCTARAHRVITACGHDVTACIRGAPTQQKRNSGRFIITRPLHLSDKLAHII
ncbi:hypothetical protein PF005_g25480 [Phytophthora fragariae]|uniref:Secreted protein n=1 Tax=Phytophthora fragariae TaxID=53985 RepID=A0A6A3WQP7_9STRA|nr:hypothetical protein PF003_g33015 [Phytophthora fragariae]KAE8923269.1 hypothetical protein PF009_g26480 [Phytophthora fragariae]KAE8973717.1 hypothetical protein PF011_g25138 [Phytophthora fragariae]KAE9071763.1 hypothetical protein PF010_g25741 [Phytophthora fragariae]KAE9075710.1 hypothetical protein PF007_g24898 [Phytophthora fragariae]